MGCTEHPHPPAAVPRGRHCDTRHGRPRTAPGWPRTAPHPGRWRAGGGGSRAVLLGRRAVMKISDEIAILSTMTSSLPAHREPSPAGRGSRDAGEERWSSQRSSFATARGADGDLGQPHHRSPLPQLWAEEGRGSECSSQPCTPGQIYGLSSAGGEGIREQCPGLPWARVPRLGRGSKNSMRRVFCFPSTQGLWVLHSSPAAGAASQAGPGLPTGQHHSSYCHNPAQS